MGCVVVDCVVIEGDDCERVGTFLVTSVGLHHQRESEDKCCTEPPEGSSAVDVACDILFQPTGRRSGTGCTSICDLRTKMLADPEGNSSVLGVPAGGGPTGGPVIWPLPGSRSCVTRSTYRSRAAHVLGWGSGTPGLGQ